MRNEYELFIMLGSSIKTSSKASVGLFISKGEAAEYAIKTTGSRDGIFTIDSVPDNLTMLSAWYLIEKIER